MGRKLTVVSLFSSGGIGDLALRACDWQVVAANELIPERASVFKANFAETAMIVGDIDSVFDDLVDAVHQRLSGRPLDALFATPPCQGMSKNGMGKLLRELREGRRSGFDPRNQLVLSVVKLTKKTKPRIVLMENVPEMDRTLIETDLGAETIKEYLNRILGMMGYVGDMKVVDFADYGVPQRRKRLITFFTNDPELSKHVADGTWLPRPTHSRRPDMLRQPWVCVDAAIGHLPPLDARNKDCATSKFHPLHRVPILDAEKYFWVSNTPLGATAFDNQCVSIDCGYQRNASHGTAINKHGINQSLKQTPVHCAKCGSLLPRPWTIKNGKHQIMSGFTSAYKRMRGDLPASALTKNLSYACSDQKIHPHQHRVLSLLEAQILHTLDHYDWKWARIDGKSVSDKLIREIIGESIPPKGLEFIISHIGFLLSDSIRCAA